MDATNGAVVRVVCHAKGRGDGERVAIVELADGRFGIARNDQLVQTLRFDAGEIESCVREFVRRVGINGPARSR